MRILFVSSEVTPFAKTGGLADVVGALPVALAALGHDVRIAMPLYRCVDKERFGLRPILSEIDVFFPNLSERGYVQRAPLPGTEIPVYFIQHGGFFGRPEIYTEKGADYPDNPLRFGFFCLAVIWMLKGLDWQPDIIHCHDWPTALVPTYLRHHPDVKRDPFYQSVRTLFTIHNLGYQCSAEKTWIERLGLPWSLFSPDGLEFFGRINLMKAGILFADHISTVSRRYAREIQTEEFGFGLHGVLQSRAGKISGILNGIDSGVWNPETDPFIRPNNYTSANLKGKAACKEALLTHFHLAPQKKTLLIGMISRLADQKGFDLITEQADALMKLDISLVILGAGDPYYHSALKNLALRYPQRFGLYLGFDEELAHRIQAGADVFLMPSRYEPCGLSQLAAMRYGTIPVVHHTGGLADSVHKATPATIRSGQGTGFVFEEYTGQKMLDAVTRALRVYKNEPALWARLIQNAMSQNFSWRQAAEEYQKLYKKMLSE